MRLPVRRLDARARLPLQAHDGDAGFDLCALEDAKIAPQGRAKIATGLAIALPPGHAGLVMPRSGLAAKHGIALVNAPGLIDEGYRGEISVLLLNTDTEAGFEVQAGMRIAQLVVTPVVTPEIVEVDDLDQTARGVGGFGSSGH